MGAATGFGLGVLLGTASGIKTARENGLHPLTGKPIQSQNIVSDKVFEQFKNYAFAGDRHSDLNLSPTKISSNIRTFVSEQGPNLKAGQNVFQGEINGIQKTILIYTDPISREIKSFNLFPGHSNRVYSNTTKGIDLKW